MKRRFLFALPALLIASVLALTACSSSNTATGSGGSTRTIVDVEGTEVQVPEHPERVVVLSEPTMDGALALGITPIGITAGRGQSGAPSYLGDATKDIPILGNVGQPNYEAIGAAQPDLILVDGTSINNNPPLIEALRHIAPTVYTGYAGGDWKYNFRLVADALNMKDQGERVIADYEAKAASTKEQLATNYSDSTFSIVRWQGNSAALILKELPAGQALTDLGLKRPAAQDRTGRGHSDPVSNENLQDIDADYMFFGTLGGSSVSNPNAGGTVDQKAAEEAIAQAATVPGFTQLSVYQNNHIIPVDGSAWTSTGGPLLMNRIIDDVTANLL